MELGTIGVALLSGWVTLALVAETEPVINEDGAEEYSTKGLIILAGVYIIRSGIDLIKKLIVKEEKVIVEEVEEIETPVRNGYELVI